MFFSLRIFFFLFIYTIYGYVIFTFILLSIIISKAIYVFLRKMQCIFIAPTRNRRNKNGVEFLIVSPMMGKLRIFPTAAFARIPINFVIL